MDTHTWTEKHLSDDIETTLHRRQEQVGTSYWFTSRNLTAGDQDPMLWRDSAERQRVVLAAEVFRLAGRVEELEAFIADFHPQAVATGEENERLWKRLEEAEALLRRLGDTLEEEINGQGEMARAELDLVDTRAFLEGK